MNLGRLALGIYAMKVFVELHGQEIVIFWPNSLTNSLTNYLILLQLSSESKDLSYRIGTYDRLQPPCGPGVDNISYLHTVNIGSRTACVVEPIRGPLNLLQSPTGTKFLACSPGLPGNA